MDSTEQCPFSSRYMRFCLLPTLLLTLALTPLVDLHADDQQGALKSLSEARSLDQLDAAIVAARRYEVSLQTIVEAKLLFAIKTRDLPLMVSLLSELEAVSSQFSAGDSRAGIASVEQWRGMISYVRALSALDKKNGEQFHEHILHAFWNCPQQAALFGEAVERFQLQEKMSKWIIDFASPVLASGEKETTLSDVLGTKKGLLLVYWAEGVPASMEVMNSIQKLSDIVRGHGIVVAGLNIGGGKSEVAAERVRKEKKITFPWLIESLGHTLSRQLEITTLPRAVLISQQGRVAFHGHPMDPAIWKALRRLAPSIESPVQ